MITKLRKPSTSRRTGRLVCGCGKGYASNYDGLCIFCRGITAWAQKQKDEKK